MHAIKCSADELKEMKKKRGSATSLPDVPTSATNDDSIVLTSHEFDSLVIHDSPSTVSTSFSPSDSVTRATPGKQASSSPPSPSSSTSAAVGNESSALLSILVGKQAQQTPHYVTTYRTAALKNEDEERLEQFRDIIKHGKDEYGQLNSNSLHRMKELGLSPIQPIHGPSSLPYARCPSGTEGFVNYFAPQVKPDKGKKRADQVDNSGQPAIWADPAIVYAQPVSTQHAFFEPSGLYPYASPFSPPPSSPYGAPPAAFGYPQQQQQQQQQQEAAFDSYSSFAHLQQDQQHRYYQPQQQARPALYGTVVGARPSQQHYSQSSYEQQYQYQQQQHYYQAQHRKEEQQQQPAANRAFVVHANTRNASSLIANDENFPTIRGAVETAASGHEQAKKSGKGRRRGRGGGAVGQQQRGGKGQQHKIDGHEHANE